MYIAIFSILISTIIYLYIGYSFYKSNKSIGDLFPLTLGKNAKVKTVNEFSSSTVATTVSLATIIMAYFELSGYFGLYLLWTVVTTTIGMLIVGLVAKRILNKMSNYEHRPSMHEFLGTEYSSSTVSLIASICTSIGFLLIFATELIVGSRFLASLVPQIPEWVTVIFLSLVGFTYTVLGGFRAVIKTDQWQMKFIWGLIIALGLYYVYHLTWEVDFTERLALVPENVFSLSERSGLFYFLIGITIMNIPTHISNMSIWQRISSAENPDIVIKGINRSIWSLALSWSLLTLLACFAYFIVTPESGQTLLTDLLTVMTTSIFGKITLFFVVLGLFGAMLSTASTNLIVVAHTVSEDIFAKFKTSSLTERLNSRKELNLSRFILVGAALLAIFLVEGLKYLGFSIADLVFAIYGGALALCPPILIALYKERSELKKISRYCNYAVTLGFIVGWGVAIYGKVINDGNLIFLSPAFSIGTSAIIMFLGLILTREVKQVE